MDQTGQRLWLMLGCLGLMALGCSESESDGRGSDCATSGEVCAAGSVCEVGAEGGSSCVPVAESHGEGSRDDPRAMGSHDPDPADSDDPGSTDSDEPDSMDSDEPGSANSDEEEAERSCADARSILSSGTAVDDLVLTAACSPYVLAEVGFTVAAGAQLVLEPGVILRPVGASAPMVVEGQLVAEGRADAPIVLGPTEPTPGAWGGVVLHGAENRLAHVKISGADTALTVVGSASVSALTHLEVVHSHGGIQWTSENELRATDVRLANLGSVGIEYTAPEGSVMGVHLEGVRIDGLGMTAAEMATGSGIVARGGGPVARGDEESARGQFLVEDLKMENVRGRGLLIEDPEAEVRLRAVEISEVDGAGEGPVVTVGTRGCCPHQGFEPLGHRGRRSSFGRGGGGRRGRGPQWGRGAGG